MAYITNDGARLIGRAKTEGKSIVFGSVRMNTIYKSDPSSLVQKNDEWFGANHGSVVGCLSHVSVDDVSCVCDSKLAIQCNDNSESWKSLGIYAHLDGEEGEVLLACESIQNGEYKDVTIVELPVTLDGVVEDFGLSEGGGGGGGGDVPANMMTTDTEQTGLSGKKAWEWETYSGEGTEDDPQDGDMRTSRVFSIAGGQSPLTIDDTELRYTPKEGWFPTVDCHLQIAPDAVWFNGSNATWSSIINAANRSVADTHAGRGKVEEDGEGNLLIFGDPIQPNHDMLIDGMFVKFDSSGYLESVYVDGGVATIGVIVCDQNGVMVANGRVSGVSMNADTPLTFQSPIQLAAGYTITYQAIFSQF